MVITLGGLGTIAAVLLVGVFLLVVALPLFRPASIDLKQTIPFTLAEKKLLASGLDDSGSLAWFCNTDQISVIELQSGKELLSRSTKDCGLEQASAICCLPNKLHAAVGFQGGEIRTGRLGLETFFVPKSDIPKPAKKLQVGEAVTVGDAVYLQASNEITKRIELVTDLSEHVSTSLKNSIIDVDLSLVSSGSCFVALDDQGNIRVEKLSSRRNLLTDELVVTATGSTTKVGGKNPDFRFIQMSGLGDQLFAFSSSGAFKRFVIRNVDSPELMEQGTLFDPDGIVTHVARLYGGSSFVLADTSGKVRILFTSRGTNKPAQDGLVTQIVATFTPEKYKRKKRSATCAISTSPRSRLFAVASEDGVIRLLQATTQSSIATIDSSKQSALTQKPQVLLIGSRDNRLVAYDGKNIATWNVDAGYPEVSFRALFGKLWYENYPSREYAWETTGHESFEPKFGLVPLIFGTIKATVYSMLFATPIALLAAIYMSQFMSAPSKSRIKPVIEMMASLPSVVLGFIAGLIMAPLIENSAMFFISSIFTVPLVLLVGAFLWQLWPPGLRSRVSAWRFPVVLVVAIPLGVLLGSIVAKPIELLLFGGDFFAWLNGRGGSGWGGWVLALFPLSSIFAAFLISRFISPWLRLRSVHWGHWRTVSVALCLCFVGFILSCVLATLFSTFFDALRWETRGGIFNTYVQRNTMVVAIGMSFAIIPLIFTIADDALSSVPDHLRSGSLGTGATPWQTTVRVVIPAATSGLFSAVMIGLGRAVGETMIVLMAAGNTAIMDWNIFSGFQTLSAAIATELPEAARGTAHYRVLFLAAVLLFIMTFIVNTIAEVVRQRFRRRAHEL